MTPQPASPASSTNGPRRAARRRLTRLLAQAMIAAAAPAAVGTAGWLAVGPASAATVPSSRNWITTGWGIHLANQADPATTPHFFNTPGSFGTGSSAVASPVTDGFATSAVLNYSSYAQFAADLAAGAISYPYRWVMYDPENWSQTPLNEQQDPAKYLRLFGQLAHAHGYKVIETRRLLPLADHPHPQPGQPVPPDHAHGRLSDRPPSTAHGAAATRHHRAPAAPFRALATSFRPAEPRGRRAVTGRMPGSRREWERLSGKPMMSPQCWGRLFTTPPRSCSQRLLHLQRSRRPR